LEGAHAQEEPIHALDHDAAAERHLGFTGHGAPQLTLDLDEPWFARPDGQPGRRDGPDEPLAASGHPTPSASQHGCQH
jgi:hypothetical protein